MDLSSNLVTIAENVPKVYQSGYNKGYNNGYDKGYNEGYEDGSEAQPPSDTVTAYVQNNILYITKGGAS